MFYIDRGETVDKWMQQSGSIVIPEIAWLDGKRFGLVGLGWVGFYGISTIVGYLIPKPAYTYILNIYMICKHIL